ncbi:hypothetical protein [Paenibacillus flagellatus]|uniref:DUF4190 domain-containing protein n=1 Tax=Paenibacillus flagellatus TaxID=2211139 RepID=A0A2V5JZM1_9BACL|nr:hypothetical protein [Paenibacillus flagellatus]PYI51742.1 hypothetical protein DLM86_22725 [Paenibacillus flagellatus]
MDNERFDEFDDALNNNKREQIGRESGRSYDEEYATEVAPPAMLGGANRNALNRTDAEPVQPVQQVATRSEEGSTVRTGGQTIGWIALALAIASLFVYPALMGGTAIVLGIIAYVQGSRSLGAWSVVIGGIALISYLVLVPYYT